MRRLVCRLFGHDRFVTLDGWEGPGSAFIYRHQCARCGEHLRTPDVCVVGTVRIRNSAHVVEIVEQINAKFHEITKGHNQ